MFQPACVECAIQGTVHYNLATCWDRREINLMIKISYTRARTWKLFYLSSTNHTMNKIYPNASVAIQLRDQIVLMYTVKTLFSGNNYCYKHYLRSARIFWIFVATQMIHKKKAGNHNFPSKFFSNSFYPAF